jgi:uncharacterized protein
MPDGVRLAVDVWLPAGATTVGRLPTVLEIDRYWRARAYTTTQSYVELPVVR